MRKVLFTLLFAIIFLGANAQLGYRVHMGFVELTPDESIVYKYVLAMDTESQETINDLYARLKNTGDKSLIKCTETGLGGWYVRKDYPLPEGNYFESDFYNYKIGDEGENELLVVLPKVQSFINYRGRIEDLLEYLGDRVTVDLIKETEIEDYKSTDFCFISKLKTSEEWLKLCLDVYNYGFEGLHYFAPMHFMIDKTFNSHLISVLMDTNEEENLVYSMNWEGVDVPRDGDADWYVEGTDEGLSITNPEKKEFAGLSWAFISGAGFKMEKNHDYIVRLTIKVPSDGTYVVNMGRGEANAISEVQVTASDDFQMIDVLFPDFLGDNEGGDYSPIVDEAYIRLCSGWVVGTTVLKKVEVYEVLGSGARGGTTVIDSVKAVKSDGQMYNLAGQKVDASYKGIVIQNGKKRIVR